MAIIHLLDDDIAVTQACAFLLESLGYEVSCWEQGEKFLAEANLHQVGVLLLDMRMPVLDGHAVHEIMRQKASTLAVVFLTGHGDVPMAVEQMKRGAVDFAKTGVSRAASGSIRTCLAGLGNGVLATRDHLLLSTAYAKRTGTGASGSKRINESGNC